MCDGTEIGKGYSNGYLERKTGGAYVGELVIDGVDLSPIEGVYFTEGNKNYLWLKRRPILEYDYSRSTFIRRQREPQWETYLTKTSKYKTIAYEGECILFKMKYRVVGIRDSILGGKKERLNIFVERLPISKQNIINKLKLSKNGKNIKVPSNEQEVVKTQL